MVSLLPHFSVGLGTVACEQPTNANKENRIHIERQIIFFIFYSEYNLDCIDKRISEGIIQQNRRIVNLKISRY